MSIAGTPVDTSNVSNLRDILSTYNKITEACFNRCVSSLNSKALTPDEELCVSSCSGKFINGNQRIMASFMENQTKKQQLMMEEEERKYQEQLKLQEQQQQLEQTPQGGTTAQDADAQAGAATSQQTELTEADKNRLKGAEWLFSAAKKGDETDNAAPPSSDQPNQKG